MAHGGQRSLLIRPAVFLDRDGVLNEPAFNPATQQFEAPRRAKDLVFYPETFQALKDLQQKFTLFVVSNQPDYALGKATLEDLENVGMAVRKAFDGEGIVIAEYFYCYHHPKGVVPSHSIDCPCRKPKDFFLKSAAQKTGISLPDSWMVGDRDTDVQCGQRAGCKTILVENPLSKDKQGKEKPTVKAKNIGEAAEIILGGRFK